MSDPWEGLPDTDERIVWQGRPDGRLRLAWESPLHPFFFLFFTGFSIFWMVGASATGGFFWTFGLLFFGIGFYNLVLVHFWRAWAERHTHYTLTTKRAFIGMQAVTGGKRLDTYPINANTQVSLRDGTAGSVIFAEKITSSRNGGTMTKDIGFVHLPDARAVFAQVRKVQEYTA